MCEPPEFELPTSWIQNEFSKGILERLRELYANDLAMSALSLRIEGTPRLAIMMKLARNLKTVIDLYEFSNQGTTRSSKEDPDRETGNAE